MEVTINGKTVDLSRAVPLTLGDWDKLQKQKVLKENGEVEIKGAQTIIKLVTYIAQKADKNIDEKDVREVPLNKVNAIAKWIEIQMSESEEPNGPLSDSSTPSD